jgi:energy-coupling factor transport system substrate-specific component
MSILLLPVAVALNVIGGQLAAALALPVYIDTIGTILAGILGGPWVGLVAGILSNCINGIFLPNFFPFAIVGGAVGLVSGLLSRKEMFNKVWKVIISIVVVTFVSIIIGTPIVMYVYGGITGTGSTYLTALLLATGQGMFKSVFTSQVFSELADKALSISIAYVIIIAMSQRILVKYPCGGQFAILKNKGKIAPAVAPVAPPVAHKKD